MGHKAYTSAAFPDGIDGRKRQDATLHVANRNAFSLLEYEGVPVGYAALFPLKPQVFEEYLNGTINQYQLTPGHLGEKAVSETEARLVFKAMYTTPEHQDREASVVPRLKMVAEHVARVLQPYSSEHFRIVAEAVSEDGRKLMVEYGFRRTGATSPNGYDVYAFNSETPLTPRAKLFVREVNKARRRYGRRRRAVPIDDQIMDLREEAMG